MRGARMQTHRITNSPIHQLFRQRRWRGSEPRDRYPVRRTADVVEPDLLEELDRRRIAAVLAADPEFEVLTGTAPPLHRDGDELSDTGRVDRREGVLLDDLQLLVVRQERARVVARHPETRLR